MITNNISQYPISAYLTDICKTLKKSPSHTLILTAQTAAGKSTILPLALLEEFSGKMIMTEPRRLAVLGVANRLSELRGEKPGQGQVGYKIHLENKICDKTRLEVVTEGILVRQLQNDPILQDYQLVIIDEFHERSVNTDLALAFLKEALELRDDLYVIIMSATINTEKLRNYLSKNGENNFLEVEKTAWGASSVDDVPVLEIPGRQFPVQVEYQPGKSVEAAVLAELERDLPDGQGNILVFLPGISDIRKAAENLLQVLNQKKVELCILHSSISLEEQKKVLKESEKRRVILASAIAETSLTVPGVTTVIDSGLARVNRMNISTGMENLTTEVESEFSAEQRKGRAGRLRAGRCLRLWSEFDPRIKDFPPEILRADITELVLECADRGIFSADGIDWLDKPSSAAWKEATRLLQQLGMLKSDFRISDKGKISLNLGISPRLAGIAIEGFEGKFSSRAEKILIKYSSFSKSSGEIQKRFLNDLERRLANQEKILGKKLSSSISEKSFPKNLPLVLAGYPDRIAKCLSEPGKLPAEYQFPSGRKALLHEGHAPEWIVAPEVMAGKVQGSIFEFEEVSATEIADFMEIHAEKRQKSQFFEGKILKTEDICYGEIILSSKKIPAGDGDLLTAWLNEVRTKCFDVLPADSKVQNFLIRVEFCNQQKGKKDLATDDDLKNYLQNSVEKWLPPFFGGATKLTSQTVYDALYWFLEGAKIDKDAPEILILPNGRKCKVKYERQAEIRPVVEIIIQRIFGCFENPEICGKKVLFRLLSPASRPLQVTDDLEGFWSGAWPEICKEMKGRYPKHNWDYKVADEKS